MIPFIDVSFVSYLKTLFPDYVVCWSPPESARQLLSTTAIKAQNSAPTPPPNNTVGIPGLAVFRTSCVKDPILHSTPKAYRGYVQGQYTNNDTLVAFTGKPTTGDSLTL